MVRSQPPPQHASPPTRPTPRPGSVRAALAAVVEGAVSLLAAARVAVLLPARGGGLHAVARRGWSADDGAALAALLAQDDGAAVLAAGRPLAQGMGEPLPTALAGWLAARDERGFLALPLPPAAPEAERRPGVLALALDPPARVTAARVEAASRFAALAGMALAAARQAGGGPVAAAPAAPLEQGTGRPAPPAADGARQAQFGRALARMLAAVAVADHVAAAAQAAAAILTDALPGVDIVNVWALDDDQGDLVRVATGGTEPRHDADRDRLPLDEGVGAARALREGQTLLLEGDADGWPPATRAFARRHGLVSVLFVPMQGGGRMTGVITLGARAVRAYTPEELSFLVTLGGQLGAQLDIVRGHARAEAERRRLLSLIETLPEGLMIVAPTGRLLLFNRACVEILGREPPDALWPERLRTHAVRAADGRPLAPAELPLVRALAGETVRGVEVIVHRPDGRDVPLLVNAAPVEDPDGRVTSAIAIFQDIAPLKELDRLKDDFINTVSHELRTPTTTIRGGALMLLKRGDRLDVATRRQLLQDIADESERLHRLVEDLLSLSRSQAGMRLSTEPVRLHRLVRKVVAERAATTGVPAPAVDVAPDLPVVEADPMALEQVLGNLLENALRYGARADRVEVTAERRGDEVVVGVLDRGPGLLPDDLDRVFEPFYRGSGAAGAAARGAGLGLAVCRRLIGLHGGRIWAQNRPGGGAAVWFTLPIAADPDE
jgi:PAS domain S-box-containing protein